MTTRVRCVAAMLSGVVVAVVASQASAHPHVWISVSVAFALEADDRLATVRQSWTYDEMFSSYALFGLDANGDSVYSA